MFIKKEQPAGLPEDPFLIIAHRGASAYAPEHTIEAYDMAYNMDADYIEIDLNRTKDGKLVAIHDVLIPYVTGYKVVADFTLAELKKFSPGVKFNNEHPAFVSSTYSHSRIPELTEIINHFDGAANFYIELKSPQLYEGIEEQLLQILQLHSLLKSTTILPQVIIQSFDASSLKKIFKLAPSIPLIKLYSFKTDATLSKKEIRELKRYASGIGVNFKALTPDFVQLIQSQGLHVHAYTVNDEEKIRSAIKLGLNGVFTNNTDVGIKVRSEKNSSKSLD